MVRSRNTGASQRNITFDNTIDSHIGNGNNTLFWMDKWLFGCSLADLAPNVIIAAPWKFWKRMVAEAFQDQ
jgi:hypothetical protein